MRPQMVERRRVLLMRNRKGMVHAAVVLGRAIDRRLTLDEDQAGAGGVEERHRAAGDRRQMPAADDLGVEAGAARDVADRDAEMHDGLDRDHLVPTSRGGDRPLRLPPGRSLWPARYSALSLRRALARPRP